MKVFNEEHSKEALKDLKKLDNGVARTRYGWHSNSLEGADDHTFHGEALSAIGARS